MDSAPKQEAYSEGIGNSAPVGNLNTSAEPEVDDCDKHDILIQKDHNNRFYTCILVPVALIGYIKGKQSATQKSLEQDTNCSIDIPSKKDCQKYLDSAELSDIPEGTTNITVTGDTKQSVCEAYQRIKETESIGRGRHDFTHFISIPINSQDIQESFTQFKDSILFEDPPSGIWFTNKTHLHLTLCMLTLLTKNEKERATEVLIESHDFIRGILEKEPLTVTVKGLACMNKNLSKAAIIYAKVEEPDSENRLQIIADYLAKSFIDNGLCGRFKLPVKLHVTLIRTEKVYDRRKRVNFDARTIFQKYEDHLFGNIAIQEIHISTRFTQDDDKYYEPIFVLKL